MTRRLLVWTLLAALFGVLGVFGLVSGSRIVLQNLKSISQPLVYVSAKGPAAALAWRWPSFLAREAVVRPTPPAAGRAVLVDLANLRLELYEDGRRFSVWPILNSGRSGTPWVLTAGVYGVVAKSDKFFAAADRVWLPDALQFAYMKIRREPFTTYQRWHNFMNSPTKIKGSFWGIFCQAIIILLALIGGNWSFFIW